MVDGDEGSKSDLNWTTEVFANESLCPSMRHFLHCHAASEWMGSSFGTNHSGDVFKTMGDGAFEELF